MEQDGIVYLAAFKWAKKCSVCKETIPAQNQGWWNSKVKPPEYYHINCYKKDNIKKLANASSKEPRDNVVKGLGKATVSPGQPSQPKVAGASPIILSPQPLDNLQIQKLYEKAKQDIEANGFEVTESLMAIALKIRLEKHTESFWINYTKWDQELKSINAKRWGK